MRISKQASLVFQSNCTHVLRNNSYKNTARNLIPIMYYDLLWQPTSKLVMS